MNEFDWIQAHLARLAGPEGLGLLDDAALYTPKDGEELVLTLDTLIEGVHFFDGDYGALTAERLLTVNLSDLAAKGARPVGYLLSVAWPTHLDPQALKQWMSEFCSGLEHSQSAYGFSLFGGDTVKTKGPMTITASFMGTVPKGQMIKRSTANIGDSVWVTGVIGDAHLGLLMAQNNPDILESEPSDEALAEWKKAFYRPVPQLGFRTILQKYATSCADISDGVLSEAHHIATASQCMMSIRLADIPLSAGARQWVLQGPEEARRLALSTGGDDYQLLLTIDPENEDALQTASAAIGVSVTPIGHVIPSKQKNSSQNPFKVICIGRSGNEIDLDNLGYTHF